MIIRIKCNNCSYQWRFNSLFDAMVEFRRHVDKEKHTDYVINVDLSKDKD